MGVSLIFNYEREVLRKEGYAVSKSARAFRGARLVGSRYVPADLGEDEVAENEFLDDPSLWQEPNTGVLFLRPNALRADLMESTEWLGDWMGFDDWISRSGEIKELPQDHLPSQPKVLTTIRAAADTNLNGLDPIPSGVSGLDVTTRFGLVWSLESIDNLYPNEGFSLIIKPFGISTDRASAFLAVAFGVRWCLILNMAGGAALYENTGTTEDQKWVKRRRIEYGQGGVDQTQEFQLTVIPWGIDCISFIFSQAAQGNPANASDYKAAVTNCYLYECKKHGFEPSYNSTMKQYLKTSSGKLCIAMRQDRYSVSLAAVRCRYPAAGAGFTLAAEVLPEPTGTDPLVGVVGYFGQNKTGDTVGAHSYQSKASSVIGASFVNVDGTAWNSAEDTDLIAKTWLKPNTSRVYSPEVWAMEYKVPAVVHSPGSPVDASAYWTKLAGRVSVEPDANTLELRYRSDWNFENLYKMDGAVDLEIDGVPVFEGEFSVRRPSFEGGFLISGSDMVRRPVLTNDDEALDAWHQLNTTSVSHFLSLTRRSYGELIRLCFNVAGVSDANIDIEGALFDLEVDGWEVANDFKATNENVFAGDVLRLLVDLYGAQGGGGARDLRIVRRNRIWKAYLAPVYDSAVLPSVKMYTDTYSLLDADQLLGDEDRWNSGLFKILKAPEWTIRRPRFNTLRGYASRGTGDGADLLACFLAAHPDSLTDPTFWDYQGRVASRTLGPNELANCSTMNELQRCIRRRYDLECRTVPILSALAEWQPSIDTDQFVMVVGTAPQDVASQSIVAGDRISYGAFRILDIAWQIDLEASGVAPDAGAFGSASALGSTARKASRSAMYALEYVGPTISGDYAMFSGVLPDVGSVQA